MFFLLGTILATFRRKQQGMSQVADQTEHGKADQVCARGGVETCSSFVSVSPWQLPEAGSGQDEHQQRWHPGHPFQGTKAGLLR